MINVGERITYFREAKGWTITRLAQKSGVSQSYLREIDMGKYANPSVEVLSALCGALDISLKEFFDENVNADNADQGLMNEINGLNKRQKSALKILLKELKS